MAQSLHCHYEHIVFSTKDRMPLIKNPIAEELYPYIAKVIAKENAYVLAIGGMPDHIHIVLSMPSNLNVSHAINVIKANSSRWMKAKLHGFAWQRGYASFSVSASLLDEVKNYVLTQREHHKKRDFKAEYIALLEKHGVTYDPRYVFD